MEKYIVSACMAGISCRYDGLSKINEYISNLIKKGIAIPLCPEQLGGLPTPREGCECKIINGDMHVVTASGKDFTKNYQRGAETVLEFAKKYNIKKAILQKNSPSCGVRAYDGTFSHTLGSYSGITAKLLMDNGIEAISIETIDYIIKNLKEKFEFDASYIEFLGEGYDSKSYVINEEYLFKFAKHEDSRNSYKREYQILNFLRDHFKSNIQIPQIEYYDESGIIGYKLIKGNPITKELYESMTEEEKEKLTTDIANFLKSLHNLDVSELKEFKTSLYDAYKADLELLREKIFSKLTEKERNYIENFIASILSNTKLFHGKMCVCHNDLSADHILIDEDKKVSGIIDFGDACIIEDYRDFMYILEESEEEVGRSFGERVLDKYAYPDKNLALEYAELNDEYYPIETIVCGIENEDEDLLAKGLKLLREKIKE